MSVYRLVLDARHLLGIFYIRVCISMWIIFYLLHLMTDLPAENPMVVQLRILASRVLFALSVNNFNAVFNRVSARLQELSTSNEENPDYADIELIQHISLDLQRLNKLLNGNMIFVVPGDSTSLMLLFYAQKRYKSSKCWRKVHILCWWTRWRKLFGTGWIHTPMNSLSCRSVMWFSVRYSVTLKLYMHHSLFVLCRKNHARI